MYIQKIENRRGEKVYTYHLLMEGYREGKKVKHRTLANLSQLDEATIGVIKQSLKGKRLVAAEEVEAESGRCFGALFAISEIAKDLGIKEALGEEKRAGLVLLMVAARIIIQGSKLACSRWAPGQATREILGIDPPTDDDLYSAMDWLLRSQERIEDKIWDLSRGKDTKEDAPTLFLYDVTSSYLEGLCNELAAYGYNRDGKRGKKQIVVGLLTDRKGFPATVEVFPGSTQDPKTLLPQIKKLSSRFSCKKVVLVGDKGMIKSAQIKDLGSEGLSYITSISKPEIESLASRGIVQLSLFDSDLCEVEDGSLRYILRKNPRRAKEAGANRSERLEKALATLATEARALSSSARKDAKKAYDRMVVMLAKLKVSGYIELSLKGRELSFAVDEEALTRARALDGCYCIKTDLSKEELKMEGIHDRYKDLALVESAFRTLKTGLLEIRPLNHRKATRTRAHAFICMLAYMIIHKMRSRLEDKDAPIEHIIRTLDRIQIIPLSCGDFSFLRLAQPDPEQKAILDRLKISLPNLATSTLVAKKSAS